MRPPFATRADIEQRFPRELALVAADEQTRLVDDARVSAGLDDASTEIRAILAARWDAARLDALDGDGLATLRMFAIDIALYRIALAFSRQTEAMKERYEAAVKRLEALAQGKGGLSFSSTGAPGGTAAETPSSPGDVLISGPSRVFSRAAFGGPE